MSSVSYKKCKGEQVINYRDKKEDLKRVVILATENYNITLIAKVPMYKSWEMQQSYTYLDVSLTMLIKDIKMGYDIDIEDYVNNLKNVCRITYKVNLPLEVQLSKAVY